MSKLYPIIQRQRRPLVVAESVPDGPPKPPIPTKTEPVQPVAIVPLVEPAKKTLPKKTSDGATQI